MSDVALTAEKLDQAVEILKETGVDLWLTFVRETTQVADPSLDLVLGVGLTWSSALMISATGERIAIVGRFDVENVERIGAYSTVVGYDQSIRPPLLEHLSRLKPDQIAVNYSRSDPAADGLTHGMFLLLQDVLRGTDFIGRLVPAGEVVATLRGRKSPTEIARLRSAAATAQTILHRAGESTSVGMSERDIAQLLQQSASEMGLGLAWDADHCPTVTVGPESAVGHAAPADHVLRAGQLLQVDFGVRKDGFVSDLQRSWYVRREGESSVPAEVETAWKAARRALDAGRRALSPGVRGFEVDQEARASLTRAGYPEFMHAFGHHIGRSAHDGAGVLGPRWERYGDSVEQAVEVGNVFAIELGITVPGYGYIGCEEDVLVTSHGAEFLCEPQTDLWLL